MNNFRAPLTEFDPSIFRAYDIRGRVPEQLNTQTLYWLGRIIGHVIGLNNSAPVVVGCDGRVSSPDLKKALVCGLRESGRDVIDIGFAPTPLINFTAANLEHNNAIAVTASHNPANQNGLKITIGGKALMDDEIAQLASLLDQPLTNGAGRLTEQSQIANYSYQLCRKIPLMRRWKLVVDSGNGIAGPLAKAVFERQGLIVIPLFDTVDGSFPNHSPDPCVEANLEQLKKRVVSHSADLGIAFDGDGDRVVIVDENGEVLAADHLLVILAQAALERTPEGTVLFDAKCSSVVEELIQTAGGTPLMGRTGHSPMKRLMKSSSAIFGGELSAHYYDADWYGFDDAIYTACRLMERLEQLQTTAALVKLGIPKRDATPEYRIELTAQQHQQLDSQLGSFAFACDAIDQTDGVRLRYPDGWALARLSNTELALVLRYEGHNRLALERIIEHTNQQLRHIDASLTLPDASSLNTL